MTKKKKIILSISSFLLVLILYGWFFGIQTVCLIGLQFVDRSVVDTVPQPLDLSLLSPAVTTLETSNCSFSVPWTNCVGAEISEGSAMWNCEDSEVYIIYTNTRKLMESVCSDEEVEKFHSAIGYEFKSNMYFVTSADISFSDSNVKAVEIGCSLLCKAMGSASPLNGVYFFEYQDVKGFQEGNLLEGSMVSLSIFDRQGWEYQLVVAVSHESELSISQADINTIITTFSVEP